MSNCCSLNIERENPTKENSIENSRENSRENTIKMPSIQLAKIFSYVTFRNMRFLILDCPSNETLPYYLKEFISHQITDVVRVCEPSYDTESLTKNNIRVHDWHFQDGSVPSPQIIQKWLSLVEEVFGPIHYKKLTNTNERYSYSDEGPRIAIHCVAGLGRAPVLVAIALIESGMESLDAVTYIRNTRRGAFNSKQIAFLDTYKRGQYNKKPSKLANIMLSKRDKTKNHSNSSNNTSSSSFFVRGRTTSSKSNNNSISMKSTKSTNDEINSAAANRSGILFSLNKIFKSKNSGNGNSASHPHINTIHDCNNNKTDIECVKIIN